MQVAVVDYGSGNLASASRALALAAERAGIAASSLRIDEEDYGNDALLSGRFDAQQGYTVDEFVALRSEGRDVVALPLRQFGHIAYSQVYFVSEAFLARHRDALVRFIRASDRGWKAAMEDVPGTAAMIVSRYEPSLSLSYQEQSLREIGKLLGAESPVLASMRLETWKANAASFARSSPHAALGPVSSWTDFSIAAEAAGSGM